MLSAKAAELTLKLIERRDEVISILTDSVYRIRVKGLVDLIKKEMAIDNSGPVDVLLKFKKSGIYDTLSNMDKAMVQCAVLEIIETI